MQCVILAAGHGKRLRPYTEVTPKHLLEIDGRPLLEHTLMHLPDEIDQVILVVGWLGEKIRERFGDAFLGRPIVYVEQTERLGTGHALTLCRELVHDKFVVMMGDNIYDEKDIKKCLKRDLCILVREVPNPQDFGVTEINEDGSMKNVVEKPHNSNSNLVNTALYVLDKRFFDYSLAKIASGEYGLPQTMAKMAKDHKIQIETTSFWLPVDTQEDLCRAREFFQI